MGPTLDATGEHQSIRESIKNNIVSPDSLISPAIAIETLPISRISTGIHRADAPGFAKKSRSTWKAKNSLSPSAINPESAAIIQSSRFFNSRKPGLARSGKNVSKTFSAVC